MYLFGSNIIFLPIKYALGLSIFDENVLFRFAKTGKLNFYFMAGWLNVKETEKETDEQSHVIKTHFNEQKKTMNSSKMEAIILKNEIKNHFHEFTNLRLRYMLKCVLLINECIFIQVRLYVNIYLVCIWIVNCYSRWAFLLYNLTFGSLNLHINESVCGYLLCNSLFFHLFYIPTCCVLKNNTFFHLNPITI